MAVVRYFLRKDDLQSAWQAFEPLMRRVDDWNYPNARKRGFTSSDFPDIAAEIYEKMRESVWELEEKEEHWEYRFWVALEREGCSVLNRWSRRRGAEQSSTRSRAAGEWDVLDRVTGARQRSAVLVPTEEDFNFGDHEALDAALASLPDRHRKAWYLRNWMGMPVEPRESSELTGSKLSGCDPRSVRNCLRAAERRLAELLGRKE